MQIINPTCYPGWDDLMVSCPDYSFFHSSVWAEVLSRTYGYTPRYFAVLGGDGPLAVLPLMEVRSWITGNRGVCLPFSDYCEPVVSPGVSFEEIFGCACRYGQERGWRYIEIRGGDAFLRKEAVALSCFGHTLDLGGGPDKIFSGLRDSTKRNIRKAQREGVRVEILDSLDSVREFYRLNRITRKRHGLPPQPFEFFRNIHRFVIAKGMGFVALGSYGGANIASGIFFHLGKRALFKYGASTLDYQNLRANNLVIWEAICRYSGQGYETLSLGRTEPYNTGLGQFKRGWGVRESQMNYYKYDLLREIFLGDRSMPLLDGLYPKLMGRMPTVLRDGLGSLFYRHFG